MGATGQAPLKATVLEMERLRCNGCGQLFTATEPEGVGLEKYDATAAAMIAQLRYGSGVPFKRLERRQANLGIPLPAATQWELIEEAAEPLQAAVNELVRQAAQGEVMHNDDTGMKVLKLVREPGDERTGVFTSGIVSTAQGRKIALYFTGRQHAGENIADVLKQGQGTKPGDSDVRCAVAERAEAARGSRDPGGELSGAWQTTVCGSGAELSAGMPACTGDAGRGL